MPDASQLSYQESRLYDITLESNYVDQYCHENKMIGFEGSWLGTSLMSTKMIQLVSVQVHYIPRCQASLLNHTNSALQSWKAVYATAFWLCITELIPTQQTQAVHPMLGYFRVSVFDVGPTINTIKQHYKKEKIRINI